MMKFLYSYKCYRLLVVFFGLIIFSGCFADYDNIFSTEEVDSSRGYTKGEVQLFFSLARLAAINYKNLNNDEVDSLFDKIEYDVKVSDISYASSYGSESVQGSASLVYPDPDAIDGSVPLLISMHHTMLRDVEAPSYVASENPSFDFANISSFEPSLHPLLIDASMGFAVYAPDMLGFGDSTQKPHPFMRKAYLMADIYRGMQVAIEEFEKAGIKVDTSKIFITGYSHGAWVATQYYSYLNTYSPQYNVVAGLSSAGVYYLQDLLVDLFGRQSSSLPLFLPYMIYGYLESGLFPTMSYSDFFKSPYDALDFPGDLFNGTRNNQYVDGKLSSKIDELYNANYKSKMLSLSVNNAECSGVNPSNYCDFWEQMETDSVVPWNISGKFLVIHHENDEVSALSEVNQFLSDMKSVPNQVSADVQSYIGVWGEGSAHEATALMTYLHGLYWLVHYQ